MIPRSKVNLRKKAGIPQLVKQIIYSWQRVLVLDGHNIQVSIVNAHPHGTILLLYKQHGRTPG
jgi:hypothetical protein